MISNDFKFIPGFSKDFTKFLSDARDNLGLDHLAYAGMNPITGTTHGHVTYDPAWTLHYAQQGYQRFDPTLHQARRSIAPVDWQRLARDENFNTVFRDAHDFGISSTGLTVPVRGPLGDVGALSVTSSLSAPEWKKLKTNIIADLQALAVQMHDSVIRSDDFMAKLLAPTLSTREVEILQWTAAGKAQQDIGDILGISHRTVEVHLRSARQKLCALTTAQAIGRAIALGVVMPG